MAHEYHWKVSVLELTHLKTTRATKASEAMALPQKMSHCWSLSRWDRTHRHPGTRPHGRFAASRSHYTLRHRSSSCRNPALFDFIVFQASLSTALEPVAAKPAQSAASLARSQARTARPNSRAFAAARGTALLRSPLVTNIVPTASDCAVLATRCPSQGEVYSTLCTFVISESQWSLQPRTRSATMLDTCKRPKRNAVKLTDQRIGFAWYKFSSDRAIVKVVRTLASSSMPVCALYVHTTVIERPTSLPPRLSIFE